MVTMFDNRSGRNDQSWYRIYHRWFVPSFSSFGQAVSEIIFFYKLLTNQKQELPVAAMFVNESGRLEQI
jgi:hypothetical protein